MGDSSTVFPKGLYCYTPLNVEVSSDGEVVLKVKPCPFYVHIESIEGKCSTLGVDILDQVKICGINEFTDKELYNSGS